MRIFILLLTSLPAASADQAPEPPGMELLRGGEARVEYTRTEESGGAARVSVLMHTRPEDLWSILLSCERSYDFVDGLRGCEVREGGVEHARVWQRVKKSWLLPALEYVIEFRRQPYTAIDFHQVEGDLKLLEGSWRFSALPEEGGLVVTHEIRVQPRFPVPRWLVRRSLARDVPDMLVCLRALSGGSADAAAAEADRRLCPQPAAPD